MRDLRGGVRASVGTLAPPKIFAANDGAIHRMMRGEYTELFDLKWAPAIRPAMSFPRRRDIRKPCGEGGSACCTRHHTHQKFCA